MERLTRFQMQCCWRRERRPSLSCKPTVDLWETDKMTRKHDLMVQEGENEVTQIAESSCQYAHSLKKALTYSFLVFRV